MIKINNLSFKYQDQMVLDDISFQVDSGKILAILGENGAGKSTLLKCLASILKPLKGEFLDDNKALNLNDHQTISKVVSYVPQELKFGDLCVFETILIGRSPHIKFNFTKDDYEKTNNIIKALQLEKIAFKKVNELSGGQKQKVAIARALNQDTKVILFDEPTSNLDLQNQLMTIQMIKEITKNGKIALVTMHDLTTALNLADEFLFLKNHQIFKCGKKEIITPSLIKEIYHVDVDIINYDGQKLISLGENKK